MSSTSQSTVAKPSFATRAMFWVGCVISALPVLALVMSATMKFLKPPEVLDGFKKLDFPVELATGLGIVEIVCTVIYVIPQSSVLGAILLTGYLGGATCAHVRVGESFIPPVMIGVLVWLGLFLRDTRIRALIPFKR